MTKQQFLQRTQEQADALRIAEQQVQAIKVEMARIRDKYIAANREFSDGEKVLVCLKDKPPHEAFIRCAFIAFNDVHYALNKVKQDGTMSTIKDRSRDWYDIGEWSLKKIVRKYPETEEECITK
jgi:hypothetical protein